MKAMVYHAYGLPDVLTLEEVEKPTLEDDEVLVKVHAASVNAAEKGSPDRQTAVGSSHGQRTSKTKIQGSRS